jgi:uncharacterized Zn finger protein
MWYEWRPYVSVAQRRAKAAREIEKRRKRGAKISSVVIEGRTIAKTFWGKAWCENLESYSDYSNRLPRGRTYVRNGSVVDLQIEPGKIKALVSGSSLYTITINITPLAAGHWRDIKSSCAGQIGSLVELLKGELSKGVMDVVTARGSGLFPKPSEIKLDCSCPDWADMCKHVAAALYGVGARLDHEPELLFVLRKVDHLELIAEAVPAAVKKGRSSKKTLVSSEVADVFGIELAEPEEAAPASGSAAPAEPRGARTSKTPQPRKTTKPRPAAKRAPRVTAATAAARRPSKAKKPASTAK